MKQNQTINYTLRRNRRAKHIRLAVYYNGEVTVSAPWHTDKFFIEKFISQKAVWITDKIKQFKKYPISPIQISQRGDFKKYKEAARMLIEHRINYFNKIYNYNINKIFIRNQRTRWGSCSQNSNLNFNYKIVLLPPAYADYIIVHELCHLGEFNHSKKFWSLVAQTIPDYAAIRRKLKSNDFSL